MLAIVSLKPPISYKPVKSCCVWKLQSTENLPTNDIFLGFLRSRRDKGKKKKTTKKQQTKDSVDNQSNKEEKSDM